MAHHRENGARKSKAEEKRPGRGCSEKAEGREYPVNTLAPMECLTAPAGAACVSAPARMSVSVGMAISSFFSGEGAVSLP